MSAPEIRVGCCGFAVARDRLYAEFDVVEVQQTFYQPPSTATAARWRAVAPDRFVFTLKAWQLITHGPTSPTYRRLREPLTNAQLGQAGAFRWNDLTRMAWERTQDVADALGAPLVVLQTPRSFTPTPENLGRLYRFFENADRRGRGLVFEPRGEAWDDAIVTHVIRDLDLVHGVDPFLQAPAGNGPRYYRLHGLPAYRYHYRYTDAELAALRGMINADRPTWILFNNDHMAEDARRFARLVRR